MMGDTYRLMAGDRLINWSKNDLPLRLLTIFRESDRRVNRRWVDALRSFPALVEVDERAEPQDTDEARHVVDFVSDLEDILIAEGGHRGPNQTYVGSPFAYTAPAGVITSRLDLMGYRPTACRKEISALIRFLNDDCDEVQLSPPSRECSQEGRVVSPEHVLDIGLRALRELRQDGAQPSDIGWESLECLSRLEPWIYEDEEVLLQILALELEHEDPRTPVELDLHELFLGDYFEEADDVTGRAWAKLAELTAGNGPIIIVTEGKSDARYLRKTLECVHPHLSDYFRFLDFETKHEGGTDQVVRTLRSLAAVGVMNRVVGVLDNDGAGAKAAGELRRSHLPDTIRFVTLPEVPYADDYPTGTGVSENVNGRATSIEFMFGSEALRAADGAYVPVQWSRQGSAVCAQGKLSDKALVKRNIDKLLACPSSELKDMDGVWEYMCAFASVLLTAATPSRFPGQDLT